MSTDFRTIMSNFVATDVYALFTTIKRSKLKKWQKYVFSMSDSGWQIGMEYNCSRELNYCFVCLFGALSLRLTVLAKLWGFFSCGTKTLSEYARISSSSVTNICVCPALFFTGPPSGAGPFPGTLNVRLASEGGLTFITPPRFDRLLPTVPTAKLCIWFSRVNGVHLIDLFMFLVIAIIALFMLGSWLLWAYCLRISAL